jgi:hypothetical protein
MEGTSEFMKLARIGAREIEGWEIHTCNLITLQECLQEVRAHSPLCAGIQHHAACTTMHKSKCKL